MRDRDHLARQLRRLCWKNIGHRDLTSSFIGRFGSEHILAARPSENRSRKREKTQQASARPDMWHRVSSRERTCERRMRGQRVAGKSICPGHVLEKAEGLSNKDSWVCSLR